jgi:O-acetyl-ADP-ribose deacetylase (regulator of RNase III)
LEHRLTSIAFPAISIGAYAYAAERAARIALFVMREHEARFARVIARCFSAADVDL